MSDFLEKEPSIAPFLREQGYSHIRTVPDKGVCAISRFIYTTGLLVNCTMSGYKGRYCYHSFAEAKAALLSWDGIGHPPGEWIKYKGEGGEIRRVEE